MFGKLPPVLLILAQLKLSLQEGPLIQLSTGQIQGREDATTQRSFYAFEKIPYAAPPMGNLRFRAPQPPEPWDGVLNTTTLDVICYQIMYLSDYTQSEDCLFLNVFTPKLPGTEDELLPVMVYLHDGDFIGKSALTDGTKPDLFVNNDVILVTLNFRLGLFGFLSTGDEVISGNNGFKDQAVALRWVQDNIQRFAGDPQKVTIFGQSSGAVACSYHLLNQNSAGLFGGAILQSGTLLSPGMLQRNGREVAFLIGSTLNSTFESSDDSEALLEFLLSADADDLTKAGNDYTAGVRADSWYALVEPGVPFGPVIETENPGAFVTEKMYGLLKAGKVLPVPTLLGITSEEKIGAVQGDEDSVRNMLTALDEKLELVVPHDMPIVDSSNRTEMGRRIREIYTGGEAFADHIGDATRYGSDNFIDRAAIKYAELFSTVADTYFYQLSFYGELNQQDHFYEGADKVAHGADNKYLFCSGSSCDDVSEADLLTRQRLIKLWTDFAKFGNPTPEASELLQNVIWPKVSLDDGDFLYVDIDAEVTVKNHPKEAAYKGWVQLYDSLGYDDFDTY